MFYPEGATIMVPDPTSWSRRLAIFALAVAAGTAVMMYIYGRQFSRRFVEQHRRMPPPTWLFRGQQDQLLESPRRRALALLPILLIAAVVYVLNT